MSQLRELAEPFKDRFVKPPPKGKHGEIERREDGNRSVD